MSRSLIRTLPSLAFLGIAVPSLAQGPALNISGAKNTDYLQLCERDRDLRRDFTNKVLQVMTAAASLGQAKLYGGCAVLLLNADDTSKLLEQIRASPQQTGAHALDDIAVEDLWPWK